MNDRCLGEYMQYNSLNYMTSIEVMNMHTSTKSLSLKNINLSVIFILLTIL